MPTFKVTIGEIMKLKRIIATAGVTVALAAGLASPAQAASYQCGWNQQWYEASGVYNHCGSGNVEVRVEFWDPYLQDSGFEYYCVPPGPTGIVRIGQYIYPTVTYVRNC
ncbi:hypothetical protein GCM10010523_31570 [Paenarthrobacter ilicis]